MPKPRLIKPISKILDEPLSKLSNVPDFYIEDEEEERERLEELEDGLYPVDRDGLKDD